MATKNTSDLKTASVLAFERKLDPSDAVFSSGLWADRSKSPATLVLDAVRATLQQMQTPGSGLLQRFIGAGVAVDLAHQGFVQGFDKAHIDHCGVECFADLECLTQLHAEYQ